jgi:hypothetical protein
MIFAGLPAISEFFSLKTSLIIEFDAITQLSGITVPL